MRGWRLLVAQEFPTGYDFGKPTAEEWEHLRKQVDAAKAKRTANEEVSHG